MPEQHAHPKEVPAQIERLAGPAHRRPPTVVLARAGHACEPRICQERRLDAFEPVSLWYRIGVDSGHDVGMVAVRCARPDARGFAGRRARPDARGFAGRRARPDA